MRTPHYREVYFGPTHPHTRNSSARTAPFSKRLRFPCALGACQELRHVLIPTRGSRSVSFYLVGLVSPPFRSPIPAIVADRHTSSKLSHPIIS